MANRDTPMGLEVLFHKGGEAPRTTAYPIKTGYKTNIYKNQVVTWNLTDSAVRISALTNPTKVIGTCAAAFISNAASKATELLVYDAREHVFRIQADSLAANTTPYTVVNRNMALLNPTLGNVTNGISKMEADFSSATVADRVLRVVAWDKTIGDDTKGADMKFRVEFNSGHLYSQSTTS